MLETFYGSAFSNIKKNRYTMFIKIKEMIKLAYMLEINRHVYSAEKKRM